MVELSALIISEIKDLGSPGIEYSISIQSLLARVIVKNTTSGGT